MQDSSKFIAGKKDYAALIERLSNLPGSEFSSLMMEVYRERSKDVRPVELLEQIKANRFCKPASINTIEYKEFELKCLKYVQQQGFIPVTLSPLSPFGTCSVVGEVDQNNIVTAIRNTEVVSDATNVLALMIAAETKDQQDKSTIKYATTQRMVRAQALNNPAFTAHFGLLGMVTGGFDTGDFNFEISNAIEHLNMHIGLLSAVSNESDLIIKIEVYDNEALFEKIKKAIVADQFSHKIEINNLPRHGDYYQSLRFKIFLQHDNVTINISDAGTVDWTQQLLSNNKHRLFISGIGLELVSKLKQGTI